MRKVILSIQMSFDGFIEGPAGEMDWMVGNDDESWSDLFELLQSADTFLAGAGMYPGYEAYWSRVLQDSISLPDNVAMLDNEVRYARLAAKTQHLLFSRTLDKVRWRNTWIVTENVREQVETLKRQPGKNMVLWGGAMVAHTFMDLALIDEYRILVNPVILGGGVPLFRESARRQKLRLVKAVQFKSGVMAMHYRSDRAK